MLFRFDLNDRSQAKKVVSHLCMRSKRAQEFLDVARKVNAFDDANSFWYNIRCVSIDSIYDQFINWSLNRIEANFFVIYRTRKSSRYATIQKNNNSQKIVSTLRLDSTSAETRILMTSNQLMIMWYSWSKDLSLENHSSSNQLLFRALKSNKSIKRWRALRSCESETC
jgi:hypothetical protein